MIARFYRGPNDGAQVELTEWFPIIPWEPEGEYKTTGPDSGGNLTYFWNPLVTHQEGASEDVNP